MSLMLCELQLHQHQNDTRVTSRRQENAELLFLSRGIVLYKFLEQSRKVMLASSREAVLGIRPHVRPDTWILRQDIAPTREIFSVWRLTFTYLLTYSMVQSPS